MDLLQGDTFHEVRSSQTELRIYIQQGDQRDTAVHRLRVQTSDEFSYFSHLSLILQEGNPNFRVSVTNRFTLTLTSLM